MIAIPRPSFAEVLLVPSATGAGGHRSMRGWFRPRSLPAQPHIEHQQTTPGGIPPDLRVCPPAGRGVCPEKLK